jgi:hypothetical protein
MLRRLRLCAVCAGDETIMNFVSEEPGRTVAILVFPRASLYDSWPEQACMKLHERERLNLGLILNHPELALICS